MFYSQDQPDILPLFLHPVFYTIEPCFRLIAEIALFYDILLIPSRFKEYLHSRQRGILSFAVRERGVFRGTIEYQFENLVHGEYVLVTRRFPGGNSGFLDTVAINPLI